MILLLAMAALAAPVQATKEKPIKSPRISPLETLERYTVPTAEISGMAWRRNPSTHARELVLVSDREYQLYVIDWEKRKTDFKVQSYPLPATPVAAVSPAAGALFTSTKDAEPPQSEFESVFADETGRVFIVREDPAQLIVIAPDLKKIESTHVLQSEWPGGDNAGAEGLLPLRNGHVLVVKEKEPLRLIEFAPTGREAAGYDAKLGMEKRGKFPLTVDQPLKAVSTWSFAPEHERLFEDSSGINADLDGTLYLLGDQRNLIGKVGKKLDPKKTRIKLSHLWSIPSEIKRAEGMVIDENHRPIVAVDNKKAKNPNLFVLSPMR